MDNEYLKKFAKHLKQIRKEKNIKPFKTNQKREKY